MDKARVPHRVSVTVDASGTIACEPDPVPVRGRNTRLKFELETKGYRFPQDGAVVVNDPSAQFPEKSRTLPPDQTKATLLDLNTQAGDHKYTVTVQQIASGKLTQLDPIIQNDP
jgi:hypothetical protein